MTYSELVYNILMLGYSVKLYHPNTILSTLVVVDDNDDEIASVSYSIPGEFSLAGESPYELDTIIIRFSQTPMNKRK